MTTAGPSDAPGPEPAEPGFARELADAFRRLAPQGSTTWNFAGVFARLETRFGRRPAEAPDGGDPPAPTPSATEAAPATPADPTPVEPPVGRARQLFRDHVVPRVEPWVEVRARRVSTEVTAANTAEVLDPLVAQVVEGFEDTVEAFRFLAARVEALEGAATRRRAPVDGLAWLVEPTDLVPWVGPITGWLVAHRCPGPVVHAECGAGQLLAALARAGLEAEGVEPRGPAAWTAAEQGLAVELGPVPDRLAARPPGSLGGLVLSGVVERSTVDEVVALVALAADRLGPGAPLVVVSARPETAVTGWPAVARDLVAGRPLHPETWQLLAARAGFTEITVLEPGPAGGADPGAYAVAARTPS